MGHRRHVLACFATFTTLFVTTALVGAQDVRAGDASTRPAERPASSQPGPAEPGPPAASQPAADWSSNLTGDWGGVRQQLADRGVTFALTYTADGTANLRGGIDTEGSTWRRLLDATITLDTQPLLGLAGGTVLIDFQHAEGPNPSDELIGDLQGIDGLGGPPGSAHQNRTQLSQLWYQQTGFDDALRAKVGKIDANTDFDNSPTAQLFLNQSTGSSATLFTMPTYPDPSLGAELFLKLHEDLQLGIGVFDGSLGSGVRTGNLGLQPLEDGNGVFLIAEIDKTWQLGPQELQGRAGVGGWYSSNQFSTFSGGKVSGTGGPYALAEQTIWRASRDPADPRAVNVFVMYGYADPTILPYDHNIGGGLTWAAPLPGRPGDILGIGAQAVHFGSAYHPTADFEVSYEAFYQLQVTPWFDIKPDIQYIANPSGNGTPDALAVTVRFQVQF